VAAEQPLVELGRALRAVLGRAQHAADHRQRAGAVVERGEPRRLAVGIRRAVEQALVQRLDERRRARMVRLVLAAVTEPGDDVLQRDAGARRAGPRREALGVAVAVEQRAVQRLDLRAAIGLRSHELTRDLAVAGSARSSEPVRESLWIWKPPHQIYMERLDPAQRGREYNVRSGSVELVHPVASPLDNRERA